MKITNIKQNTWEWHQQRMRMPTASEFDQIIQPGGKKSESQTKLMYKIIFQRIYKCYAQEKEPTVWMDRGQRLESEAARTFENLMGRPIIRGKFITTNDGKVGCSPDGIIIDSWECVEIKVPEPWKHIMYTNEGPLKDYKAQIYGQMYVGEFKKAHFLSYCPGMPCRVHTIERDEDYIGKMELYLKDFVPELDKKEKMVRALGNFGSIHENT